MRLMLGNPVTVSDSIVFWAFRYCLGRRTYSVSDCVENILLVWDQMTEKTRRNIVNEIEEAIQKDEAGMDMDKREWLKVLERHYKGAAA